MATLSFKGAILRAKCAQVYGRGTGSAADGLVAARLLEHEAQPGDLGLQLVSFFLELAQLIATDRDIEGLDWGSLHQGSHLHTSQLACDI